ncbi:MAG: DUF218 domain-containing protein [Chloroflexaceae bacterium]|nr:DUF218 domain-containing protein [Chloroflexaceae bacterium]
MQVITRKKGPQPADDRSVLRRPARHRQRWLLAFLLLVAGATLAPLSLMAYVVTTTRPYRYTEPASIPPERVAIVFGAGVRPDGRLSPMLADRVEGAIRLYQSGRVQKLLMTGDNSHIEYNEVSAMKRYAVAQGVPARDITLDYAGFSTYESCYRAREIFGVTRAVLVTQSYHLPRAIYTCRHLGVEAVGLGTPDWGVYSSQLMQRYTLRELLATLKAMWDVHLAHPLPTFLGPYEGVE